MHTVTATIPLISPIDAPNLVYKYCMSKNSNIPDTWGIPDDQANRVRDALSKKSIRPEDRVQEALDEIAREIAIIEADPKDWEWWVTYLQEQI